MTSKPAAETGTQSYKAATKFKKQEVAPAETHKTTLNQLLLLTPPIPSLQEDPVAELKSVAPATEVRDVRIEDWNRTRLMLCWLEMAHSHYDIFELSNPQPHCY